MKKRFLFALLGLLALIISIPALAIAPPTSISINAVNIYGGLLEAGDMGILVEETVSYAAYPTEPANQAYLMRFMSPAGVELAATTLYDNPYYHDGYGNSCSWIYLSAADVTTLGIVWGGSSYVRVEGNPALTWTGTIPLATANVTSWTASGATALGNRVLYLAAQFQSAWGLTSTTLLVASGALTSDGEVYFTGVIPELRMIVPTIFSSYVEKARYYTRSHGLSYAVTLRSQWIGTWLDLTTVAADWSVDPIWLYGGMWVVLILAGCWVLLLSTATNKFLTMWVFLMCVLGTFAGFLSYLVGGIAILICVVALVNQLAWSKSGA